MDLTHEIRTCVSCFSGCQHTISAPRYFVATNIHNAWLSWFTMRFVHAETTWTLAPTTATQTVQHFEYFEFRYAEVTFTGLPAAATSSQTRGASLLDTRFNVSAWAVRMTVDTENGARMQTSNDVLDAVWELCRYTIEASPLDLYADSNARQRSAVQRVLHVRKVYRWRDSTFILCCVFLLTYFDSQL